jgi:MoxR-like ATPase
MENFNWGAIEKNVNESEEKKHQGQNASQVLFAETGLQREERTEKDRQEILEKANRKRVTEKALERENFFNQEAEKILGQADSPERVLVGFRMENLAKALRYEKALETKRQVLLNEEVEVLKSSNNAPRGEELEALDEIREELKKNQQLREDLLVLNPEAYFGLNLKKLKESKKEFSEGRIVETDYVKEKMEDIELHLRADKPILIYGHLGSGKSELAMHAAKKYSKKPALIISGSKNISQAEFYGHQVLTVDENSGSTVSDFYLGPIYQAMEEGRVVIIDEVNAIPHEVLISLNHLLTRKVGDKINIQQDSGREIEIQEGFGIIMTGNLNQGQEKYIDRQDMDPAFLSRLHKIEYDYLPQNTEGTLEDEASKENEQFQLLLVSLMDKNGNLEIPEDSLKKLWNLAKSARIIQNVFAGKELDSAYYFKEAGGRSTRYLLKESVLSLRGLENVISQWKAEGFAKELDYYVYNNFIKEGTVASDRAYLYQLMKDQFGFFQTKVKDFDNDGKEIEKDSWPQNPNYGSGGVVNSFDITTPKNPAEKRKFFTPRRVVEFAFGKAPERTQWPQTKETPEFEDELVDPINPEVLKLEEFMKNFKEKEKAELWKDINEVCELGE